MEGSGNEKAPEKNEDLRSWLDVALDFHARGAGKGKRSANRWRRGEHTRWIWMSMHFIVRFEPRPGCEGAFREALRDVEASFVGLEVGPASCLR